VIGDVAEQARALVRDVPDYPTPGVVFKDITPLLGDGPTFSKVVAHIAEMAPPVDLVVGMEARGFILGAPVAVELGVGFVPIRKSGKLPRETFAGAYDLEYGSAVLEMHQDAAKNARVLIVDDVLATGGTAAATVELLEQSGNTVAAVSFLMELTFLNGRDRLGEHLVQTILNY